MEVDILDNRSRDLLSVLAPAIAKSQQVKIAVAFVSRRGLEMIRPSLDSALTTGAMMEFLVGLDMHTTEPDALEVLHSLCKQVGTVALYCYASPEHNSIYHPKMYLLNVGDDATAIIGSSNLTQGGLKGNIEANVMLTGSLMEDALSDAYGVYSCLKFLPGRVIPDDEFLAMYRELQGALKRQDRQVQRQSTTREMSKRFQDKVRLLRRPAVSSNDLVGWLRLVYQLLPEGEFTNQQLYEREEILRQYYPQNRNIRPKARQQLQILRTMGLVEHLDRGHWRKR